MQFDYKKFEVIPSPASKKTKVVWRPVIPIFLKYQEMIVGYEALIDSGADYNVFDGAVAEVLGIQLTQGHKRQLIGLGNQPIKAYEHSVKLRVGRKWYTTKATFSNQVPPNSYGVLGNRGFFNQFVVTLNYQAKIIETV